MAQSRLPSYGGNEPVWGFVAQIADERFTGHAVVGINPRVHLWAHDGFVYFAERVGATELTQRLVASGAITTEQLAAGSIVIDSHPSIGRLFKRCPDVDRDVVELTVRITTETLLSAIAESPVGMPEVHPLRHHPAGIHLWLRPDDENPLAVARDHSRPTERPPAATIAFEDDIDLVWADPTPVSTPTPMPMPTTGLTDFEWPEFADRVQPVEAPVAEAPRPHLDPTPVAGITIDTPPPLHSLAFLAAQNSGSTETVEPKPEPAAEPPPARRGRRGRKQR